jgi:hypothetical protein
MGFYTYIQYKRCFDWAYGKRGIAPGTCTELLEKKVDRTFMTRSGKLFCLKQV